jgi:hypothetical protein
MAAFTTTGDLLTRYRTGGSANGTGLSDPTLDSMIDRQSTLVKDEPARRRALLDIQRKVIELAAVIPTAAPIAETLVHANLKGWSVPTLVWEHAQMQDVWIDQ